MTVPDTIRIGFPDGIASGGEVKISGSKSQSNRLLLLQAATGGRFTIDNLSDSHDTRAMLRVLAQDGAGRVDVGHAGTAMRFGTAFLAVQAGRETLLTGSDRMKQRPIAPLVEALRALGADIRYDEREGYPPLRIRGGALPGGECTIDSSVSSQFITALMLVAPTLERGLHLHLSGRSVSRPYIELTASVLRSVGLECSFEGDEVRVPAGVASFDGTITVESDWSSASYYYALAAVARKAFRLTSFRADSVQGDSRLARLYGEYFGVDTVFAPQGVLHLVPRKDFVAPSHLSLDMENTPDVAQSVAVTMAALRIKGRLTGLQTLRVKETDRIAALDAELAKFGVVCTAGPDTLALESFSSRRAEIFLETYQDHRMAMAFVPLAWEGAFSVLQPDVVSKSYPRFWEDMASLGLKIEGR